MDVEKALTERRSIRRYLQTPVPREALLEVAGLCRFAPSGGNRQEWEIVLVDDGELLDRVFETLAWLPAVGPPPPAQRPTAYMIIVSQKRSDALADCAAVTTYLLLAAHARGLGSCWFGSISRTQLAHLINLPDEYAVEFVVALGYPDEAMATFDSDDERCVSVASGVTQVPKRSRHAVIHVNTYDGRGDSYAS